MQASEKHHPLPPPATPQRPAQLRAAVSESPPQAASPSLPQAVAEEFGAAGRRVSVGVCVCVCV